MSKLNLKQYSQKRPKVTGDASVDRALKKVYDDINHLVDSVNTPAIGNEIHGRDGKPGDIRIVVDKSFSMSDASGETTGYFLEAKTDDGWVRQYMDKSPHSGLSREGTIPMNMIKWRTKKEIKQGRLSLWKSDGKFSEGATASDVYIDEDVIVGKNSNKTMYLKDSAHTPTDKAGYVALYWDNDTLKIKKNGVSAKALLDEQSDITMAGLNSVLSTDAGATSLSVPKLSVSTEARIVTLKKADGTSLWDTSSKATAELLGSVGSHSDVDSSGIATNKCLKWNGTNWVPGSVTNASEFTYSFTGFTDNVDTWNKAGSGTFKDIDAAEFTCTFNYPSGSQTATITSNNSSILSGSLTTATAGQTSQTVTNSSVMTHPGVATVTMTATDGSTSRNTTIKFSNVKMHGSSGEAIDVDALTKTIIEDHKIEAPTSQGDDMDNAYNPSGSNNQHELEVDGILYRPWIAWPMTGADPAQVRFFNVTVGCNHSNIALPNPTVYDFTSGNQITNSAGLTADFQALTMAGVLGTFGADSDDITFTTHSTTTANNFWYWGWSTQPPTTAGAKVYLTNNILYNTSSPGYANSFDESIDQTSSGSPMISSGSSSNIDKIGSPNNQTITVAGSASDKHLWIAYPDRYGDLSGILQDGATPAIGDFVQDCNNGNELPLTNYYGFQEDYRVYVSENPGISNGTTLKITT